MNLLRGRFQAAVVSMTLASLSVAGEPPKDAANSNGALARPLYDIHAARELDGLSMHRPYQRGKVPVVLIHGLWGFPHQWDPVVHDLEADPLLRGRYQFWTFSYASGDPIPFSAHLLRQSLRRARRTFDPDGTDPAFDRMVVVGHSLGGILAKMMAQDSNTRLWQTASSRSVDRIAGRPEDCLLFRQAFCYEIVPEVRRVIFIATPHRGTPIVRGVVRDLGMRICDRASRYRAARETLLSQNEPDFFLPSFRGEDATSVSTLAWGHPLLMALCDLGIDPSIPFHSIIADLRDPPAPDASDGIVPYSSSHLECADSEVLFHGHHICLNDPAVIHEVRRILIDHAGIDRTSRTDRSNPGRDGLQSALRKNDQAPIGFVS
jgi:pimeloyl-ACP methyl ester carboxylesterase